MKKENVLTQVGSTRFHRCRLHPRFSGADAIFFGEAVGCISRDDMTDPAERAARPDPETWSENKPEKSGQDSAIVKLPDAGNKKTENACCNGITHCLQVTSVPMLYARARRFVLKNSKQYAVSDKQSTSMWGLVLTAQYLCGVRQQFRREMSPAVPVRLDDARPSRAEAVCRGAHRHPWKVALPLHMRSSL